MMPLAQSQPEPSLCGRKGPHTEGEGSPKGVGLWIMSPFPSLGFWLWGPTRPPQLQVAYLPLALHPGDATSTFPCEATPWIDTFLRCLAGW